MLKEFFTKFSILIRRIADGSNEHGAVVYFLINLYTSRVNIAWKGTAEDIRKKLKFHSKLHLAGNFK